MKRQSIKTVTAVDVARLSGVSPASVQRVFNPAWENKVKPETRDKVLRSARELNYAPNAFARILASNKTNIIAIILGPITGYYYSQVLVEFIYQLQNAGKQIMPFTTDENTSYEALIQSISQYRVDAIIMTSVANSMSYEPVNCSIPIIYFERVVDNAAVKCICSDTFNGGRMAADLLLDNGHKRIALISGNDLVVKDYEREYGFSGRLHERGVSIWRTELGRYSKYESGRAATRRIMNGHDYPDAFFCADDVLALGCIDVLRREYNVRVPGDISVVGFRDIGAISFSAYAITTVHSPVREMVTATLEYIQTMDHSGGDSLKTELFPMRLVIRDTVRITDPRYEKMRADDAVN